MPRKRQSREEVKGEFLKYYADVQHILSPGELESFEQSMQRPLPTTFWLNATDPRVYRVREMLMSMERDVAKPLTWYPEPSLAWRVEVPRNVLRKDDTLKHLHRFLISYSEWGVISRQEEVSMLPPYYLDIQPHDRCLDMCASPGSKTAQIMYLLGRHKTRTSTEGPVSATFDYSGGGLVVANEMDVRRADMLVCRMKRMAPLYPYAIFTTHDARKFPSIPDTLNPGKEFRFDKILCDVMCSGDGTMRKNTNIWKEWAISDALSLNPNQLKVVLRGAQLLRVGGRIVYSTCSMNPIEDEAVVYHLIRITNGAMKLVDGRQILPTFQGREGLTTWDVVRGNVKGRDNTPHTAFPPKTPEEGKDMNLQWCIRVMPHDADTGGFFIAVLEKVAEFDVNVDEAVPTMEEEKEEVPEGGDASAEKPIVRTPYIPVSEEGFRFVREFYSLDPEKLSVNHLVSREQELAAGKESASMNFVSPEVRAILTNPDCNWKIINAGLRTFAKDRLGIEHGCAYRPCNEAVGVVLNAMNPTSPRLIHLDYDTGVKMLQGPLKSIATKDLPGDEFRKKIYATPTGGIVLVLDNKTPEGRKIPVAGLRTAGSLQACVDSLELPSYLFELDVAIELK